MTAGAIRSAQRSRAPAGAGRVAAVVLLAVVAGGAALCLANLVLARAGLGFEPMRSRQDADEMLVRREFRTHVVTNALGFRERRMPGPAAPGTLRVVALGDSFTQGYGVADGERFTDLLERALARRDARPVEVGVRSVGASSSLLPTSAAQWMATATPKLTSTTPTMPFSRLPTTWIKPVSKLEIQKASSGHCGTTTIPPITSMPFTGWRNG